ncbi:MAG: glycoside hydrolase family 113 [Candidatus Thorarchaeota archaeon]
MDSEYSSEVFPDYERDNDLHWTITPDEALLRRVLRLAEDEGLQTWLRVQVWVAKEYKETVSHFVWRGSIEPRSVSQWFESYTAECLDVARIAEQEGVDTLTIGVELLSMRKHVAEWERMVASIRSVFGGMVTYDEATHHPLVGPICEGESFAQVAGPHWESFDRIEMNYWQSPNCLPLDTRIDQRFSSMVERFAEFWMPAFRYYRSTYPSKPIAYGELGHFICDGTVVEGWWSGNGGPTDYQEAADVWATYLIAAELFETSATSVWSWFLNDPEPPECDLVNIRDTPASQVVASFITDKSTNQRPNSPSLISAAVAEETRLSNLIIDLSAVPWIESYSQSETPSKLFTEQGQRPVSEGANWGLPGGDVKGIKVRATEQGTYIYWETYGQSMGESYAYLMHLRPPDRHETVAIILLDPATGLVRFDLAIGSVWYRLHSRIEIVDVAENSVTAFIPEFELPSGDLATDFPGWEPVALLVWAMETPEQETYEFPHTNVLR